MDAPAPLTFPPPVVPPGDLVALSTSDQRPSRGRGRRLVALMVVAVVIAAGVGAWLVVRGRDTAEAFSLTAAAQRTTESSTVAYDVTVDAGDTQLTASAVFDASSHLLKFDMDLGNLLAASGPMTVLFDAPNATMYVEAGALADLGAPISTPWVKYDLTKLMALSGADASVFEDLGTGNPLDAAALFATASKVEDVGFDEVRGEKVKHFIVTVDMADALATMPALSSRIDTAGLPTDIVYDVYVNEANELRRIHYGIDVGTQALAYDMVISTTTAPPLTLPDPQDVTDLFALLGR